MTENARAQQGCAVAMGANVLKRELTVSLLGFGIARRGSIQYKTSTGGRRGAQCETTVSKTIRGRDAGGIRCH